MKMCIIALDSDNHHRFIMTAPNIIVTGFMATGKTTVGRLLAEHLDYNFVDTDDVIVERAGMPVVRIFEAQGEAAFRKMESELARELGSRQGLVISTGGGMLLNPENAAALSRNGQIFCLVATPEEIFDRVSRDTRAKRPLLESDDPMLQLTRLLRQREQCYKKFTQVRTSAKPPEEVVSDLIDMIRANPDLQMP